MKLLDKAKAKIKLTMMTKGVIEHVSMEEIPDTWQNFGSRGDQWIHVEFPESENTTGCIYVGMEDSVFDPHIHDEATEHLTVLNVGGDMEVVTDKWIKRVKYPDAIVIPKGVPHAVIFHTETKILVMWHPKFESGWNADFIENLTPAP